MFKADGRFEKFETRVLLSSPTMHGDELRYMTEAYETNWMSTVGENINDWKGLSQKKPAVLMP